MRHRLEDLGRIYERLSHLLDDEIFSERCEERFIQKYEDADYREQLFHKIQNLSIEISDILQIASGNDSLNYE